MLKDCWDDDSDEAEADFPTPPEAAPGMADDVHGLGPLGKADLPDDVPCSPDARLFWGCAHGSLRCIAQAVRDCVPLGTKLRYEVMEELETLACTADVAGAAVTAELGDSAMHIAARAGVLEAVLVLLALPPPSDGERVDWLAIRNRQGENPLDVCSDASVAAVLCASRAVTAALMYASSARLDKC